MGRGLWFVAGAGTGVYAMVRARRIAEAFTPEGLTDRVGALALGARMLADDVRVASAEREAALRDELGLHLDGSATAPELAGPVPAPRPRGLALAAPGVDVRAC